MKQKPCFSTGKYKVFVCRDENNNSYYTVVNTALGIHRHHPDLTMSICVAKACSKLHIPQSFNKSLRRDCMYLITGGEEYGSKRKHIGEHG